MVRVVQNLYSCQKYGEVIKDYKAVLNLVKKNSKQFKEVKLLESSQDTTAIAKEAVVNAEKYDDLLTSGLPFGSAYVDIKNRVKSKDYPGGFVALSQASLNLPNTIDDFMDALDYFDKSLKSKYMGKNYVYLYKKSYDFKKAQHPFSYFRGTLLKDFINPNSPKCPSPRLANWIIDKDRTLWKTGLQDVVKKGFKLDYKEIRSSVKDIKSTSVNPINVKAYSFISNSKTGKIIARAMARTPLIGLFVSAILEGCQVINEVKQGEEWLESIEKAVIRWGSSAIITGLFGAVGMVLFGPAGSFLGVCLAAMLNTYIATELA